MYVIHCICRTSSYCAGLTFKSVSNLARLTEEKTEKSAFFRLLPRVCHALIPILTTLICQQKWHLTKLYGHTWPCKNRGLVLIAPRAWPLWKNLLIFPPYLGKTGSFMMPGVSILPTLYRPGQDNLQFSICQNIEIFIVEFW